MYIYISIYIYIYISIYIYIICINKYIVCDFTWGYQRCSWIYDWFVYVLFLLGFLQNIAKQHR